MRFRYKMFCIGIARATVKKAWRAPQSNEALHVFLGPSRLPAGKNIK